MKFALWIALAALLVGLCFARLTTVTLEDDNLYLIYASQAGTADSQSLAEQIIRVVQAEPECDLESWRLTFRERYKANYLGYTTTQQLVQSLFSLSALTAPMAMVAALVATKALFFLLLLGLVVVAAVHSQDIKLRMATVFAVLLLAVCDVIAQWTPTFWIVDIESPVRVMLQIGYSLVFAHDAHSLFGLTPRNAALAAFALAFLLKWQARPAWASCVIFAIGLLHQTYGGLAVAFFSIATAVSSPAVFERISVRALLTLSAVVYMLREQYWGATGIGFEVGMALVIIAVAQLAFSIARSRVYHNARQILLRGCIDQPITMDAATLVLIAMVTTVVCLIGGQLAEDPIARLYFWSDLTIRIWSLCRFPVLIAVLCWVARHAALEVPRRLSILNSCLVVALATSTVVAVTQGEAHGWARLQREVADLEAEPAATVFRPRAEEARTYYLLAAVAAGQIDANTARERLYGERPIQCGTPAPKQNKT